MKQSSLIQSNIAVLAILSTFIIISLNLPVWLSQGSGQRKWSGSLLSKSGVFYTNFSCNSKNQSFCNGLLTLWRSGVVLLSFDTITVLCFLMALILTMRMINEMKVIKGWILGLTVCGMAFQLLGFGFWAIYSKGTFGDCRRSFYDSADAGVCLESGSIFAGVLVIGSGLEVGFLVYSLYFSEKNILSSESKANSDPEIKELGVVM